MRIEYENLLIRTATEADAAQLTAWWNDGSVMAHAGFPMGLGTTKEKVIAGLREGLLVIEENGRLIGECNYRPQDENIVQIGIKICETDCQNRGVGRKILSMLITRLFADGYQKIVLDTNLTNVRAQHVYESLGFTKLRVNKDSWKDQLGNPQSSVDYELLPENFISFLPAEKKTVFQKGGSEYIQALVDRAVQEGTCTATVSGDWEIASAVRLPSDFTLILSDCHLRLKDGSYTNIFVNAHHETPEGNTRAGTDHDIAIIGRGRAVLDGGEPNGLHEKVPPEERKAPLYKNNLLLFTNVNGFKVENIHCRNQRWWALNFIYCVNGTLRNLDFCANDAAVDENGRVYHGLRREKHKEVLVKNADGIDLRQGCSHVLIENITGFTEDDTVALTALNGRMEACFKVEGMASDISHVKIRNVRAASYCSLVRLLNQGDIKLHDIEIDGVTDMCRQSRHLDHGRYAVRVGDQKMYGTRHSTKDETYNITVKNVFGDSEYALALAGEIDNLVTENITCGADTKLLLDCRNV